jgi:DNA-binding beta-propeller fold protein YncE
VHAGARGEDLVDGPLATALLAQPMGIATDGERLYFVDAESSAVRTADLAPAGAVRTIVGTGLFDFGDEDGTGDDVRMQHQQGLALHPASGRLLVADSYNDALKWVDPVTRQAETWVRGLHEPGGVAFGAGRVYVADTNAHRIAVVDEATGAVAALEIAERGGGAELTG